MKLSSSYKDTEVEALQNQVRDMEKELGDLDAENIRMEAEFEEYSKQLADCGVNDLNELGGSLHKINAQMAKLQVQIANVEHK